MGGCISSVERRDSGAGSAFSDSSLSPHTKNKPLKKERVRWKSDIPLSEVQVMSKREEFWDTAPAFEGKVEIWTALKAAAEAVGKEDYEMAQAIIDGAGISLPGGSLVECYDELGTRYSIPAYCLSLPLNLLETDRDSPAEFSEPVRIEPIEVKLKMRLSTTGEDVRLLVNSTETVHQAKLKLSNQENIPESSSQRWYYGGKLLGNRLRIGECKIPNGHVVQCIINPLNFDIIQAKE